MLLRLIPDVYRQSNHPIGHRPPYILKYVEANLRKEKTFSVTLIDQHISDVTPAQIEESLHRIKPGVVIFDVSSLNEAETEIFSQNMCAPVEGDRMLIAVGHAPSANPDAFREKHPQFHVVLAGEAEQAVVKIIRNLTEGQAIDDIRHMYKNPPLDQQTWTVSDLDALPFPEYNQAELRGYHFVYPLRLAKHVTWGHILSSRGCPHQCVFCSQIMRESYGTAVRLRSATSVTDEIEHLLNSGANMISFDDDNFTNSQSHVRAICEEILRRRLNIRWIAHARVDEVDEPLLHLMRQSGCLLLRYGVETVSKKILECIGKTPDPGTWPEKTRKAVGLTRAHGIGAACLFMIGCPEETLEDLENDILFAQTLRPDIIQVAYFTPFPGSRYYTNFLEKKFCHNVSKLYHYSVPRINPSQMRDQELKSAQALFYKKFLLRPAFLGEHICRYFIFYILNPRIFLELIKIKKELSQPGRASS
ncbi:MAG: radical SAM protein [Candidatus Omnitrophota bacterium]|jgi:radical SAM superfamily enzyme YgiQ (UPF0313 family)